MAFFRSVLVVSVRARTRPCGAASVPPPRFLAACAPAARAVAMRAVACRGAPRKGKIRAAAPSLRQPRLGVRNARRRWRMWWREFPLPRGAALPMPPGRARVSACAVSALCRALFALLKRGRRAASRSHGAWRCR